ncbi:MAG: transposase, partial [Gammaproteobacteria bacterium]
MESTNIYGEALAEVLYDHGYTVSIVNPARIKGFAQSELSRTKTDKADAKVIARFCLALAPAPWTPDPQEIRELKALVRRLESLVEMRQQEVNRLHVAQDIVVSPLEEHIAYLDQEIKTTKQHIREHIDNHPDLKEKKTLLESIPGIGEATINVVLSEFANIEKFRNAKQLAAFIGVAPRERQSGSSVRGRTMMS